MRVFSFLLFLIVINAEQTFKRCAVKDYDTDMIITTYAHGTEIHHNNMFSSSRRQVFSVNFVYECNDGIFDNFHMVDKLKSNKNTRISIDFDDFNYECVKVSNICVRTKRKNKRKPLTLTEYFDNTISCAFTLNNTCDLQNIMCNGFDKYASGDIVFKSDKLKVGKKCICKLGKEIDCCNLQKQEYYSIGSWFKTDEERAQEIVVLTGINEEL